MLEPFPSELINLFRAETSSLEQAESEQPCAFVAKSPSPGRSSQEGADVSLPRNLSLPDIQMSAARNTQPSISVGAPLAMLPTSSAPSVPSAAAGKAKSPAPSGIPVDVSVLNCPNLSDMLPSSNLSLTPLPDSLSPTPTSTSASLPGSQNLGPPTLARGTLRTHSVPSSVQCVPFQVNVGPKVSLHRDIVTVSKQAATSTTAPGSDHNQTSPTQRDLTKAFSVVAGPFVPSVRPPLPVLNGLTGDLGGPPTPRCVSPQSGLRTALSAMPRPHNRWSSQVFTPPTTPNPSAPRVHPIPETKR